jgi:uncharacterized protein DUF6791
VLIELASHNEDIQRLLDKGYALRVDGAHLVVRDIFYLDQQQSLQTGALVAKLVPIDKVRVKQDDHQVYFAGGVPHGLDGHPLPNLGGGPCTISLEKQDVVVQRSFSNKPPNGFANFFDKIEHYVGLICSPAVERYGVSPLTYRVDNDVIGNSVFKFMDSLSSRAEISDLNAVFKTEVIAIIGLGGTGAYLLDFLVKMPVMEIRGFDGDDYHVHTAFRSPGRLNEDELGECKAMVYQRRYENFRHGLKLQKKYIDSGSAADLQGVTFAFVGVDKGSARKEIFDLLIGMGIPFIDVGMGLNRKEGALAGTLRATYYSRENAAKVREMKLAEMADDPNDLYRRHVQISELNAVNAWLAIIRYKQVRGFYVDDTHAYHLLMDTANLRLFAEAGP